MKHHRKVLSDNADEEQQQQAIEKKIKIQVEEELNERKLFADGKYSSRHNNEFGEPGVESPTTSYQKTMMDLVRV